MSEEESTFAKANDAKCQLRIFLSGCPEAQTTANRAFKRAEVWDEA
jgi:hypothetical protein